MELTIQAPPSDRYNSRWQITQIPLDIISNSVQVAALAMTANH